MVLRSSRLLLATAIAVLAGVQFPTGSDAVAADRPPLEMTTDILATQVRKQGYACVNPKSVARDVERSTPAHAMWVLTCENGKYMVHLVPKMAARVEEIK